MMTSSHSSFAQLFSCPCYHNSENHGFTSGSTSCYASGARRHGSYCIDFISQALPVILLPHANANTLGSRCRTPTMRTTRHGAVTCPFDPLLSPWTFSQTVAKQCWGTATAKRPRWRRASASIGSRMVDATTRIRMENTGICAFSLGLGLHY